MKRISLFLLLFLLLKATVMYSQDGHPETNFRIVPVSPNAASLGTYGLIPTDNYVGQARISIPIYEIDLDGKKFPIALSYHTDGTRVAQEGASSDKCRVRTTLQHVDAITLLMLRG